MIINLLSDYDPHPGQVRVRRSRVRFKNLVAGRRWGKDYAGARDFIERIFREDYPRIAHLRPPVGRLIKYSKPLLHYWAVAPNFPIGKIQQREIFSIFPQEFQADKGLFNYDDNKKELRLLGGRILIEFKSADRPEDLVGVGLDGVYCTEFARFKDTAWDANIRPTLTDKRGWGIFTTTPLPKKWFMDFVAFGDPNSPTYHPSHANFLGKTIDNIRILHIKEEVEVARKTLPPRWFRREYEASLECFEGQIYEEWNYQTHCPVPFVIPKFDHVIAGVDWGYAQAGVILVVGVKFVKGRPKFWVLDESYDTNILIDGEGDSWKRRAMWLKVKWDISTFYCDTSEPGFIQVFRNAGLNAVFADKEISEGIQSVASALHVSELDNLPSMQVDRDSCTNLTKQIIQYQYVRDEEPLGVDDHCCDALRYAIHTFVKHGGVNTFIRSELREGRS